MSITRGIVRIARFRADGLAEFEATKPGLLNSIAPLVAFPLVGALLEFTQGQVVDGLSDLFASVAAIVLPLVISEFLAVRWGVGDAWLRYAVAFNWSQWTIPMAVAAMFVAFWLMAQMGVAVDQNMLAGGAMGVVFYGVALHFFLIRRGLGVSRLRASALVVLCDVMTVIVVLGPRLLAMHLSPNS